MELDQLRTFVEVAELGTSLAAAEKLHTSQSSVSRSLQKLEAELGCELFTRTKNHLELNDDGKWVLPRAKAVLREAEELVSGLKTRQLDRQTIHVGTCAPAPLWKLLPLLAEWDPGAIPVPENLEPAVLERRVGEGTLDVAVWPGSDLPAGTVGIPFMEEQLQVALPKDHPLATKGALSMRELDGETFLLYAGIGIWKDAHLSLMPNAHYVVMHDFVTFSRVAQTSPLPRFVTRDVDPTTLPKGFVVQDLTDDLSHISFYLFAREDNTEARRLFRWLERRLRV